MSFVSQVFLVPRHFSVQRTANIFAAYKTKEKKLKLSSIRMFINDSLLTMVICSLCWPIRLENEHLNNVGNFRAFKSVPLPFNYDEDGNKEY